MSQLPPSRTPLALFPDFVAQRAETVVIKGRYVGDSYDITTLDGRPLLTVKAEAMSLSHRKRIYDANGRHIFNIRKETWNITGNAYWIEHPSNDAKLFTLESKSSMSGRKFSGTFTNAVNGQQEQLLFKNNPFGLHGTIANGATGTPVANIDREMFKLRKEYHVTVAPGVDIALIVGMCICFDDRAKSDSTATAAVAGGGAGGGGA